MSTRKYKNFKGLKKENLRDNMSTMEIVLNMLAEATTTELTKAQNPQGLAETGKSVITSKNAAQLNELVVKTIEAVADDDEK